MGKGLLKGNYPIGADLDGRQKGVDLGSDSGANVTYKCKRLI